MKRSDRLEIYFQCIIDGIIHSDTTKKAYIFNDEFLVIRTEGSIKGGICY